jgi:hypothetical protein
MAKLKQEYLQIEAKESCALKELQEKCTYDCTQFNLVQQSFSKFTQNFDDEEDSNLNAANLEVFSGKLLRVQ